MSRLLLVAFVVVGLAHAVAASAQSPSTGGSVPAPAASQSSSPAPAQTRSTNAMPTPPNKSLWESMKAYAGAMTIWAPIVAMLVVVGSAYLLYKTIGAGANPLILRLTPSFFFWLGMMYIALLLLLAGTYDVVVPASARPILVGGVLPLAVPWFGALGAVTISLEGVFLWNDQWDKKYNYWHIGRPLFGAVLGIVAFFLFVVIMSASGSWPKFFDDRSAPAKDYIVFYVLAFLVGYREETFRELIKRATDLILKPNAQPPAVPAITFKVAGAAVGRIQCPNVAPGGQSSVTVEVQNSGGAPLAAPVVTIAPVAPTPAGVFAKINDQVTGGGDVAPGRSRTVDITFTPTAAGTFAATLSVTSPAVAAPKVIGVTGTSP